VTLRDWHLSHTVVVNGKKHLFNHIEKIKEIKFE
jgi:hypothetical protein